LDGQKISPTSPSPGKTANLLLLSVDPLVSVDAWNEIESVVLRGEVLPRESLAVQGD
jgi:imidazolonepropionase-like amidohydrolase